MRQLAPKDPMPLETPETQAPELADIPEIRPNSGTEAPPSVAEGAAVNVIVSNKMDKPIRLLQLGPDGNRQSHGEMAKASQRLLRTHVGATWLIENTGGKLLGHFIVPPNGLRVKVE